MSAPNGTKMPLFRLNSASSVGLRIVLATAALLSVRGSSAQGQAADSMEVKPVPVFTMGTAFISTFEGGTPT